MILRTWLFHTLKNNIYGAMGLSSRKVCVARNSKTVWDIYLKLHGYIINGMNQHTCVFSSSLKIDIYGVLKTLFEIEQLLLTSTYFIVYTGLNVRLLQGRTFGSLSK
jgi:hypothetical protein